MIIDIHRSDNDGVVNLPYFQTTPKVLVAVSKVIIKLEKPYKQPLLISHLRVWSTIKPTVSQVLTHI